MKKNKTKEAVYANGLRGTDYVSPKPKHTGGNGVSSTAIIGRDLRVKGGK